MDVPLKNVLCLVIGMTMAFVMVGVAVNFFGNHNKVIITPQGDIVIKRMTGAFSFVRYEVPSNVRVIDREYLLELDIFHYFTAQKTTCVYERSRNKIVFLDYLTSGPTFSFENGVWFSYSYQDVFKEPISYEKIKKRVEKYLRLRHSLHQNYIHVFRQEV